MAVPARRFEVEAFVEERIARLEEKTDHIQSDITEMKTDIRRIDAKVDAVRDSVAVLRVEMKDLEGRMRDSFAALNVGRMLDKVWWLLISAALLGVMARGFKWI